MKYKLKKLPFIFLINKDFYFNNYIDFISHELLDFFTYNIPANFHWQ